MYNVKGNCSVDMQQKSGQRGSRSQHLNDLDYYWCIYKS